MQTAAPATTSEDPSAGLHGAAPQEKALQGRFRICCLPISLLVYAPAYSFGFYLGWTNNSVDGALQDLPVSIGARPLPKTASLAIERASSLSGCPIALYIHTTAVVNSVP